MFIWDLGGQSLSMRGVK